MAIASVKADRRNPMDGRPVIQKIPAEAGIGLRQGHVSELINTKPSIAWLEIHSENYLCDGGPRRAALEHLRETYPISCHGVGLSLGSAEGLDENHLTLLRALFDWINPGLVSEHVAWSVNDGTYMSDLMPLPYTDEAMAILCRNIDHAQQVFGRQLLIENPSSYVSFVSSTMAEWEFIAQVIDRTGCGLLLDVNNIHVSAHNLAFDAGSYLRNVPLGAVREVHVAGHLVHPIGGVDVLIDDHASAVSAPVWRLLGEALKRLGRVPILVEWDTNIPALSVVLAEAAKAQRALDHLGTWNAGETADVA